MSCLKWCVNGAESVTVNEPLLWLEWGTFIF